MLCALEAQLPGLAWQVLSEEELEGREGSLLQGWSQGARAVGLEWTAKEDSREGRSLAFF